VGRVTSSEWCVGVVRGEHEEDVRPSVVLSDSDDILMVVNLFARISSSISSSADLQQQFFIFLILIFVFVAKRF